MGYKHLLFASIFSMLFSSCLFQKNHVDYADEVMFSYAKEVKEKNQLELDGFGGAMMHDIQKFNLSFASPETPHLEEARKLFIETAENFIRKVNDSPEIRPHLHEFPINYSNLELQLGFDKSKSMPPSEKCIYYISVVKGKIRYRGYDSEKGELFKIHEELYEEALKIVQESRKLDPSKPQ